MIITDNQKEQLKKFLLEKEYELLETCLKEKRYDDFFIELNFCVIDRFDKDCEATDESDIIEKIYDEIAEQNRPK